MDLSFVVLIIFVVIVFFTDVKSAIIPNKFVVAATLCGLAINIYLNGYNGFIFSVMGMGIGFAVVFLFYLFGAFGAGDVKLFGAIGAITGMQIVLLIFTYSVLCACIIGLFLVIKNGELILRMKNTFVTIINFILMKDRQVFQSYKKYNGFHFPFMYAVLPGVILAYLYPIII